MFFEITVRDHWSDGLNRLLLRVWFCLFWTCWWRYARYRDFFDDCCDFRCEFSTGVQPKDFESSHDSFVGITVSQVLKRVLLRLRIVCALHHWPPCWKGIPHPKRKLYHFVNNQKMPDCWRWCVYAKNVLHREGRWDSLPAIDVQIPMQKYVCVDCLFVLC